MEAKTLEKRLRRHYRRRAAALTLPPAEALRALAGTAAPASRRWPRLLPAALPAAVLVLVLLVTGLAPTAPPAESSLPESPSASQSGSAPAPLSVNQWLQNEAVVWGQPQKGGSDADDLPPEGLVTLTPDLLTLMAGRPAEAVFALHAFCAEPPEDPAALALALTRHFADRELGCFPLGEAGTDFLLFSTREAVESLRISPDTVLILTPALREDFPFDR